MKLYGNISKTEKQDDGTLLVTGIASSEVVDCDGEIVTAEAMKAAIPDYMKFGAVREMHDAKKAAGTAVSIEVLEDGRTAFTAHVVDPIAVKKVETEVYKGFSIGGKVLKRNELKKNQIDGLRLSEISLVDRPANPSAMIHLFKAEGADADDAGEEGETELDAAATDVKVDEAVQDAPVTSQPAADVPSGEVTPEPEAEKVEAPVAIFETMVEGAIVKLFKNAEGKFEVLPDEEEIKKGAYSIARLADLAEGLEYFSSSCEWDCVLNVTAIPQEARTLAAKLYDLLLGLVSENVAAAKQRLKDAKKASEGEGDLAKMAKVVPLTPELEEVVKLFGDREDQPLEEVIDIILKRNVDLETQIIKYKAMPAAPKAQLRVVAKGEDISATAEKEDAPVANDTLSLIKNVHQSGGERRLV